MSNIFIKKSNKWNTIKSTSTRGYAYLDNRLLKGDKLAQYLSSKTLAEIKNTIKNMNGFFGLISHENKEIVFAATDQIRSIPIFYGKNNNDIYISDDPHWIKNKVGDKTYDTISEKEFLLTGYVTGSDTLYKNVKQLQAGELLIVCTNDDNINIFTEKYFQYYHIYDNNYLGDKLDDKFYNVLVNVFNRLINLANGRTIIIPLSGGYDSRLIALMLKRLKYNNILAFTYGKQFNKESKISKIVADTLGIKWLFVPYNNKFWYNWFRTNDRKLYYLMADGLSSLPHPQDWPAIGELKKSRLLPEDGIIVPGHSAGLHAGVMSKFKPVLYETKEINFDILVKEILDQHYALWDWHFEKSEYYSVFRKKILLSLGDLEKYPDIASAYESWETQERQAKFIVNSVRVYDFWGYDWSLPFWDKEFIDFWRSVPKGQRLMKKFYISFVEKKYSEFTGLPNDQNKLDKMKDQTAGIKNVFSKTQLYRLLKKATSYIRSYLYYDTHEFAWYGIMKKSQFRKLSNRKDFITVNIYSYLVLERLCKVLFNDSNMSNKNQKK